MSGLAEGSTRQVKLDGGYIICGVGRGWVLLAGYLNANRLLSFDTRSCLSLGSMPVLVTRLVHSE